MTNAAHVWERLCDLVVDRYDRRKEVSDKLGMSFAKAKALRRIAAGPLTMQELAEQLVTDRPYATLLVDDLERRGLVERTVHAEDRRRKLVTATKAGREAAATATQILATPPDALLALPATDLATLDAILTKLADG